MRPAENAVATKSDPVDIGRYEARAEQESGRDEEQQDITQPDLLR